MNLCAIMGPNVIKNTNNLFKLQFIMHLSYVLCEYRVLDSSYLGVNYSIRTTLLGIMYSYEAKND
jgi:hypothetical protein